MGKMVKRLKTCLPPWHDQPYLQPRVMHGGAPSTGRRQGGLALTSSALGLDQPHLRPAERRSQQNVHARSQELA